MTTKHTAGATPGPWRVEGELGNSPIIAGTMPPGEPDHVCQIIEGPNSEDHANAELIVRAVNSHAALVEALRRCALRLDYQTDPHTGKGVRYGEDQDAIDEARAALQKAGAV